MTSGQDRMRWHRSRMGLRHRSWRRAAAIMLALAAGLGVAGCGQAGQGAPVAPRGMTVSSEAFSQNILPQLFTCHGERIHPPLSWSGAPGDTKSLAVVVDDSSAPITPYIYWLVFGIQPGTTDIQEGTLPTGARQALNSAGTIGYDAPCPSGHGHWYRFTVYALDRPLTLPNDAPLLEVWSDIAAATIARGRIVVFGYP